MGIPVLDDIQVGQVLTLNVTIKHADYDKFKPIWDKCRDAHEGEDAVKAKGTTYLPKLNGQSKDEYANYTDRAQFFNATNRTVESYLGMIFRKDPEYIYTQNGDSSQEVNEYLQEFFSNITHDGKSLDSFIHDVSEEIIITNRVGVLVDMPPINPVERGMSLFDYEQQKIKPMLSMYKPESIVNWHWVIQDNQILPVMYVLYEQIDVFPENGIVPDTQDRYRILYLENWEDPNNRRYKSIVLDASQVISPKDGTTSWKVTEVTYPLKEGQPLSFIPFYTLTDRGIEPRRVYSPMINDLVNVNIGHYRNSADWENELHWVGTKTIYFPDWDAQTYGDPKVGGALAGPKDTIPVMLEASSDSGLKDEMVAKEQRMAILGAERISQKGRYLPSAETARITSANESSVLANMVNHLSKGFTAIANFVVDWAEPAFPNNMKEGLQVDVKVNDDFYQDDMNGDELLKWMQALHQGGISYDTYYYNMSKKEVYAPNTTKELEWERIEESADILTKKMVPNIMTGVGANPFVEGFGPSGIEGITQEESQEEGSTEEE